MLFDIVRNENKRYINKGSGIFYAVILNIIFFAGSPMLLKYIWPSFYNLLTNK